MSSPFERTGYYFEERTTITGEGVFTIFSAPWLSSIEQTYLWITGFKPSLILRLVESGVDDLSSEWGRRLRQLRVERDMVETMVAVQVDNEVSAQNEAMERLRAAMVGVLESADALRGLSMRKVTEVPSLTQ
ncbi:TGA transcription factor [Trema orientale]|uniref:TGA transcription factor n=1 Tax=Trema orientale TaxID=63057 RepID=A0A2P5C5X7_TREOI|nr:TGA transcription factor [Trema orientale]